MPESFADGTGVAKILLCHRLINNHQEWAVNGAVETGPHITGTKVTAGDNFQAQSIEIIRCHSAGGNGDSLGSSNLRVTFDFHSEIPFVSGQRQPRAESGYFDAWQSRNALQGLNVHRLVLVIALR